jgi:hypothetical protein
MNSCQDQDENESTNIQCNLNVNESLESLQIAKELASTELREFTHGSDFNAKQIDCVQFLLRVVLVLAARHGAVVSSQVERALLVQDVTVNELNVAVPARDVRTHGVRAALLMFDWGEPVDDLLTIRPGDFVQYWIRKKKVESTASASGSALEWMGHAAIVEQVQDALDDNGVRCLEAKLFGSHASINGIGSSTFWLRLFDSVDRHVFVVRARQAPVE